MKDNSLEEILKLDSESRYEIFLAMVSEERDIWILQNTDNQFLKIYSEDDDVEFLPVWPHSDFALSYGDSSDQRLSPKCISVPEFFAKWVSGLEGDNIQVGVFPDGNGDVWIMSPSEIKNDLQEEFSNFGI